MKVLTVLGLQGSAGKTMMALHWAIEPAILGPVVVIDTDPRGTAVAWGEKREEEAPAIHKAEADQLGDTVKDMRKADAGLCVIDTTSDANGAAQSAASLASLVVIPSFASVRDLEQLAPTIKVVQEADARAVIVLNAIRSMDALADEARKILESYELPVCPTPIGYSADLAAALSDGRGVQEVDPKSKPADDILASWFWIKERL
jgi:chromosome partitioning protein